MSPTEFSNYIKQRALQQQGGGSNGNVVQGGAPGGGRALSPADAPMYFPGAAYANGSGAPNGAPGRYAPSSTGASGPTAPAPPADRAWAPPAELAPRYQPLLLAN